MDLVWLMSWHLMAGSLAGAYVMAREWWRSRPGRCWMVDDLSEMVSGPMGMIEMDKSGWPAGTERWRA